MNTNILLIIIIVLLVLDLFLQLLQLTALSLLPSKFVELFVDSAEDLLDSDRSTEADVIEINTTDELEQKNSKGFSKSSKSKRWKLK